MKRTSKRRLAASFISIALLVSTRFDTTTTTLSTYTTSDIGVFGSIGVVTLGVIGIGMLVAAYGRYQNAIADRDAAESALRESWDTEGNLRWDLQVANTKLEHSEATLGEVIQNLRIERNALQKMVDDRNTAIAWGDRIKENEARLASGGSVKWAIPARYHLETTEQILLVVSLEDAE